MQLEGGGRWWPVWAWDEPPTLPHYDALPVGEHSFFPPPGGLRILAIGFAAPHGTSAEAKDTEIAPATRLPDLLDAERCGWYENPDHPGMHRTDSIDIGVVVSGEVTTEASDGTKVVLGPGDVYIQNGALHAWHANPERPAHVVFVTLRIEREPRSTP